MIRKAIYPGTFDPFTMGHLEILRVGLKMFDEIYIVVSDNHLKKDSMLSVADRLSVIDRYVYSIYNLGKVSTMVSNELTVETAKRKNCLTIIRGVRNIIDFQKELDMSLNNYILDNDIETIFIPTKSVYSRISSTSVRELIKFGKRGVLDNYLHPEAIDYILSLTSVR